MFGVAEFMAKHAAEFDCNEEEMYVLGLLHDIGRNRFASMLMLADQDGAGIYLHLPPSKVDKEWVMGAITAFYGVVSKHNLGYGKRVRDIWEEMDERNDSYEFVEDETI